MKRFLSLLLCGLAINYSAYSQTFKWNTKKHFTVVSYNVENLFDTINTPNKNDSEFTPKGLKKWNTKRYFDKIDKLAFVLASVNKQEYPELIALIEIENANTLKDLTTNDKLKKGKYNYITEESPDSRGIDCALLYRPESFKYISHKAIPIRFAFNNQLRTRDILYVKGVVNKDTLHVFVNHWSSRRGGKEKSEPKRIQAAQILKHFTDSISRVNKKANILIMGDFNDEPANNSLYKILGAGQLNETLPFTNYAYANYSNGKGTYYYRSNFDMLDNFILNKYIRSKNKGFRPIKPELYIYKPNTICYTNKNGDKSPAKTYGGKNYYGGFSDHFPIYMYFFEK